MGIIRLKSQRFNKHLCLLEADYYTSFQTIHIWNLFSRKKGKKKNGILEINTYLTTTKQKKKLAAKVVSIELSYRIILLKKLNMLRMCTEISSLVLT